MSDIVEELRSRTTGIVLLSDPPQFQKDGLCQQAADEIERLREENAGLREALKPFAELKPVSWSLESDHYFIDTADIHAARAVIGGSDD